MLQATSSPFIPIPVMTYLPGLPHVLTPSQFLMHAHAPSLTEKAQDLDMFARGCWSLTCWRQPPGVKSEPQQCMACCHHR
jgi:hypothetical protein